MESFSPTLIIFNAGNIGSGITFLSHTVDLHSAKGILTPEVLYSAIAFSSSSCAEITLGMISLVEYIFVDVGDNINQFDVTGFDFTGLPSTTTNDYLITSSGGLKVTTAGRYTKTSTGEYLLTSTGEYVMTSTGGYVLENGPLYTSIIW